MTDSLRRQSGKPTVDFLQEVTWGEVDLHQNGFQFFGMNNCLGGVFIPDDMSAV